MSAILTVIGSFFSGVFKVVAQVWNLPHGIGKAIIGLLVFGLASYFYIQGLVSTARDEGYREGWVTDSLRADGEYQKLVTALVETTKTLERERRKLPPVVVRYRSVPVPDSARVDSLERLMAEDRRAFAEQYAVMEQYAYLRVDTTVQTEDRYDVTIRADIFYDPPYRTWTATFYPYIDIERYRERMGYIVHDTTRYDYAVNIMAGYNRGLAGQISAWYRQYGIGASMYQRYPPTWWAGWRLQW